MERMEKIQMRVDLQYQAVLRRMLENGNSDYRYFMEREKKLSGIFSALSREGVFGDPSFRAVVGVDEEGRAKYWDLTEGNLLLCGDVVGNLVSQGSQLALLSLFRFSEKELICFSVCREERRSGFLTEDGRCRSSASSFGKGNCADMFEALRAETEKRLGMSESERQSQPYVLAIFAGIDMAIRHYWREYRDMFSAVFTRGKELKTACVLAAESPMENPCFYWFKDFFPVYLLGRERALFGYVPGERGRAFLAENARDSVRSERALYCRGGEETVVETWQNVLAYL